MKDTSPARSNESDPNKASSSYKVLSFDPAIGAMGWALLSVTKTKRSIKVEVTRFGLLKGDTLLKIYKDSMFAKYGKQYTTLHAIKEAAADLIRDTNPTWVVSEAPFAHRFVQVFASLKLVVDRLRQAAHLVMGVNLFEIAPKEVKVVMTGSGSANKDQIKSAILKEKNLKIIFPVGIKASHLSEHEYDAIAVGYCYIKKYIEDSKEW